MATEVTPGEARQGPPGRPMLRVLVASLVIAAVALIALLAWQQTRLPDGSTAPRPASTAVSQPTTAPTPPTTSNNAPAPPAQTTR